MRLLQEKSICCHRKINRFGGKRRQCAYCKKTWSIHPARQGRKSIQKQEQYLQKVFCQGYSVKQIALRSPLSLDAVYKRFNRALTELVIENRTVHVEGQKLVLIIDAIWQYFKGNLWTIYFIGVKPSNSDKIVLLDPVLYQGKEHAAAWNCLFDSLPHAISSRTCALVSDGVHGIEKHAANREWIIQRCHFHLLRLLQKMRGKKASTPGKLVREEIYQSVKQALSETSKRRLNILYQRLNLLAKDHLCPRRMRMITRDFLRRSSDFRSYLEYPELNLPTTVNVIESVNSLIRRRVKTVNSPKAWLKWAIAVIRFKSIFTCK